jgi:hypothetical protein
MNPNTFGLLGRRTLYQTQFKTITFERLNECQGYSDERR